MRRFFAVILITLFLSLPAFAEHEEHTDIVIGFLPYLSSQHLLEKYQPLADYLSEKLNNKVIIHISQDYQTHLDNTAADKYDISFLGGSPYVHIADNYGKKPLLVRYEFNGEPYFRSVIFSSKQGKIKKISELGGKNIAFGNKNSTLSTQVPMYMLLQNNLDSKSVNKIAFLDNHENVILGVLSGDYDAGGVAEEVFQENVSMGLRKIGQSQKVSTHVFVASPKLSKDLQDKVRMHLLDLNRSEQGREILHNISKNLTGFAEVEDSDYDVLRNILRKVLPVLDNL